MGPISTFRDPLLFHLTGSLGNPDQAVEKILIENLLAGSDRDPKISGASVEGRVDNLFDFEFDG